MISYNSYTPDNYIHYQEGDLIIAQSREKNTPIKILKGIVTEPDNYKNGETYITVKRCGYGQTYIVPTKSIVVRIPSIYPRFDELKAEFLSMSSEDGKEYERLYNIYKIIDGAKYYIGDYVICFYKTMEEDIGKFRPCIITKLDIDADGKLCYDATNIEGNTIRVYESDITMRSTYEDYQRECREYEICRHNESEEPSEDHNAYKINTDSQTTNSSISLANDTNCIRIDNNVSYDRLDRLEEKHKKTGKLVKLGISLLLAGI